MLRTEMLARNQHAGTVSLLYLCCLHHNYVKLSIMTLKLSDMISQVTVLYMHSSKAWIWLYIVQLFTYKVEWSLRRKGPKITLDLNEETCHFFDEGTRLKIVW